MYGSLSKVFRICIVITACTDMLDGRFLQCGFTNLQWFNPEEQLCCGGTLYDKESQDGKTYACCNRTGFAPELYDEHNQLCCGSQLEDKFDPASGYERTCCKGLNETQFPGRVVEEGMTCCGGKVYSKSEDGHMGCCGAISFDRNDYMCCENEDEVKLHPWSYDVDCCGLAAFNYSSHYCYFGESLPRVTPLNIFYSPRGVPYDKTKQILCDDEEGTILDLPDQNQLYPINYKCCNKALIDSDLFKCCPANTDRNTVEHPIRIDETCCGNSSVKSNSRREQCCNGVPNRISKEAAEENPRCCGPDYISAKYECCNGQRLEPESACCGNKEAYSRNSPMNCCGDHLYNTNDQVCCSRSSSKKYPIFKKEKDHTDCCIKTQQSYNKYNKSQEEQCAIGKKLPLKPCPYCDGSLSRTFCKKKSVYVMYVMTIDYKLKGTVITGYSSLGSNLTVRFPYRCVDCIKEDEKIAIFTNRRPKNERLRLNGSDMITKYDLENIAEIQKGCKIRQKIIRTIRREIRRSYKKHKDIGRSRQKQRKSRRRQPRRHRRRIT